VNSELLFFFCKLIGLEGKKQLWETTITDFQPDIKRVQWIRHMPLV